MSNYESIGVKVPKILMPPKEADFFKWAVVACDQYTSQLQYWEDAESIVGDSPSTLNLILPEAYLGSPGELERIESVKRTMDEYLNRGVIRELNEGFVFVRRRVSAKERLGLIIALDLEQYDYSKGSKTLIRATEGTIVDRIPPRLRIRSGASVEVPHILVLIDDPNRTVIEPLSDLALEKLYDTDLMLNGGHVEGYLVDDKEHIKRITDALTALTDDAAFKQKYGPDKAPLLFAMGDGNHSFATAKAAWDSIKANLSESERKDHPARYALVEIENVHDDGIVFEPIHRVLFGVEPENALCALESMLKEENGAAELIRMESESALDEYMEHDKSGAHLLPFYFKGWCGLFRVDNPLAQLCVGTLQNALDKLNMGEVDYIHGRDVVMELSNKDNAVGFILPGMKKSELFATVVYDGALPRKTFSMGEANEKRYYMECRRIKP